MAEAKGAKKVALDIMKDMLYLDPQIAEAQRKIWEAQIYLESLRRKKSDLEFKLKDLIERCMESFGSDEGK